MSTAEPSSVPSCAACGADGLVPHLRVAGEAGPAGLIPTTDRFGTALADIVRCPACGHMQLAQLPSEEALRAGYEQAESADYLREEPGQRATAQAELRRIERHVRRGKLLDVGCWLGFLLDEARNRGWEVSGLEPSRFACAFARERLGLPVQCSDLFAAHLDGQRFDAMVLDDVLEHLPAPGRALRHLAELAAPGAVLHLALPDAGSRTARMLGARWWSVIPTHVQYFTRRSLTTLLRRYGWEPLEITTAPKAFTVAYYLGRLGGYSPAVAQLAVGAVRRMGLAERLWAPDFRDRMALVARAPAVRSGSVGGGYS